ncbi:hypothetical protein Dimus_016373 [Dionaea muscipula]
MAWITFVHDLPPPSSPTNTLPIIFLVIKLHSLHRRPPTPGSTNHHVHRANQPSSSPGRASTSPARSGSLSTSLGRAQLFAGLSSLAGLLVLLRRASHHRRAGSSSSSAELPYGLIIFLTQLSSSSFAMLQMAFP